MAAKTSYPAYVLL